MRLLIIKIFFHKVFQIYVAQKINDFMTGKSGNFCMAGRNLHLALYLWNKKSYPSSAIAD